MPLWFPGTPRFTEAPVLNYRRVRDLRRTGAAPVTEPRAARSSAGEGRGDSKAPGRAEQDDVVGKLKVSAVLQALPGIGKIRATQIMEKLKIADSRRLRGLGEQQRKALLGEFAANGK